MIRINTHSYPIDTETWLVMLKDHLAQCRKREESRLKYETSLSLQRRERKYTKVYRQFGAAEQALRDAKVDLEVASIVSATAPKKTVPQVPAALEKTVPQVPAAPEKTVLEAPVAPEKRKQSAFLAERKAAKAAATKAQLAPCPVSSEASRCATPLPSRRQVTTLDLVDLVAEAKRNDAKLFVSMKLRLAPYDRVKAGDLRNAYFAWTTERKTKGFSMKEMAEFFRELPGVRRTHDGYYAGIAFL